MTTVAREYGQDVAHERLFSPAITITEPGYVYIYLSNEQGTNSYEVYFDDFKVTHTKSPVIQTDDYYAFGLTFNSYSRENSAKQNNLYQGKELQDELGLNLYDFEWRHYDPTIGRTPTLDPHANKYSHFSPYSWAANNPVSVIDPDGRDIIYGANGVTFTGADAQAAFAVLQSAASSNQNEGDPCKGPDCDKKKKEESNKALIGAPVLVGKEVAKKTVTTGGGGLLGFVFKALGLTVSFVLSGPEAGKGSAFVNSLSREQEVRYRDLQNKRMAEGLDQAEELEYQDLVEEKFPHGNPYEQSFEKMQQGNNQKKNQEVTSLYKEFGITDKDTQRKIHDLITGKNLTRDQIKEVIKNYINGK